MRKKIVLVNQDSGYMTIDLANAFAEKYDEVVLMAGIIVSMNVDLDKKVKIHNIARYNRKNSFTRAYSWALSTINVFFCVVFCYPKHELFFSTNPPTLIFSLLFLRRPFSLIVWDLYPDALIMGSFTKWNNPIVLIWAWVNKKVLPHASSIITLTKGMESNLGKYVINTNVHVIPAWASGSILPEYRDTVNPFIQKYELGGKFIILYSGNLGKEHEVEALVYLADKLKNYDNIEVLIAGKGWKYEFLNREIRKYQLVNCKLLPKQSVELFQAALAAANLGVVSLTHSAASVSIPSKTYNLLAAGKPILCIGSESSDLALLLKNSKTGEAFSSDNIAGMAAFILNLMENAEEYSIYCKNAIKISGEFTAVNAEQMVDLHLKSLKVKSFQSC